MHNTILNTNWKHSFYTRQDLYSKGFRWNNNVFGYSLSFPVYRDTNKRVLLECVVTIFEEDVAPGDVASLENQVRIDVIKSQTKELYAPFYNYNKGYETFIKRMNDRIYSEFKRLGIYEGNHNI